MEHPQQKPREVNFLDEKDKLVKRLPPKKSRLRTLINWTGMLIIVAVVVFSIGVISSGENLSRTFGNLSLWGQIKHLASSEDKKIDGEEQDRINVLLLGIGGENHDGPYLADTIMVASYKPSTNQVALFSVPRDLSVYIPGYGYYKINHAYAFGESDDETTGGALASQIVGDVLGLDIQYFMRIDFNGFEQLIDDLDGVNVLVENTLEDPYYPVPGKEMATTTERYEHLYIEEGEQHMDGSLALKYARSRQGYGIEGSDFARSKRQQNLIFAIKEKALSFGVLANPVKLNNITETLSNHIDTNLEAWEMLRIFNLAKDITPDNVYNYVFDDSPEGLLFGTILEESGAYVLLPRAGDFSEMQQKVTYAFNPDELVNLQPQRIEVHNGTRINGLASRVADQLRSEGHTVIRARNALTQDYERSVIYDLSKSAASARVANEVSESINAPVSLALPDWLDATSTPSTIITTYTDILVILGLDQQ